MPKFRPAYIRSALLIVIALFLSACGHYPSINVKVVDAETSEPIEGAVLISHWNVVTGVIGMSSEKTYKVVEEVSDDNGHIHVPGASNSKLLAPTVNVYKKGYVAWNNEYIFPSLDKRKGYRWRNGYEFRLERFKEEYSRSDHVMFMKLRDHSGSYDLYRKAWRWEALRNAQR